MSKAFDWVKHLFHKPQPEEAAAALPTDSPEPPTEPLAPPPDPPADSPKTPQTTPRKVAVETFQVEQNPEALEAWQEVAVYLKEWGPYRAKGAPELPARTEYTLRRIGGLANFRDTSLKDFTQAWNEAPIVDHTQNNDLTDRVLDGVLRLNQEAVE